MNGPYDLWLIGALLAQGAIALALLWALGAVRIPLVMNRTVRIKDVALSREAWPEQEKRVSNAFDNQFQLPVLFYVAGAISLHFGTIWIEVLLAWLFVLTRIVHAFVFATTNHVVQRFSAYTAGYALLIVLWLELITRLVIMLVWNQA